jgi:hypothetical protein
LYEATPTTVGSHPDIAWPSRPRAASSPEDAAWSTGDFRSARRTASASVRTWDWADAGVGTSGSASSRLISDRNKRADGRNAFMVLLPRPWSGNKGMPSGPPRKPRPTLRALLLALWRRPAENAAGESLPPD